MQTVTISPEERTLAAITHLSGLSGYIIPLGGVVVPIIIWIVKSESRVISSIAKQAILLNLIVFVLVVSGFVLLLTIILIPIAILMWVVLGLVAIVLPIVGALKANQGIYYRYPVVGIAPEDPTTVPSQV
ncbi:MAG TPA: DUF4870 domain-containing protein [Vicinamibacterales bacterium]|jgi:hypothetical protein